MNISKKIQKILFDYGIYIVAVLIFVAFSLAQPNFCTGVNMVTILSNTAPLMIASIGIIFVLITASMDLSTSGLLLCSATLGGLVMKFTSINPYLVMLLTVVFGFLIGIINGFLIEGLKINGWLATLATQLGLKGLALYLSNSSTFIMPEEYNKVANFKIFGLPSYVVFGFLMLLVMQVVLKYTTFGRKCIATGCDAQAAEKLGIKTSRIRFWAYALSGAFAGLAGVALSMNMGLVSTTSGNDYHFLATLAAVLGGTSLYGGIGNVFPAALFGVFMFGMLENGLSIVGTNPYYFGLLRGILIYLAILIDSIKNIRKK